MEQSIGYYFDENMPKAAAVQLRKLGIDVKRTQDVHREGTSDISQLRYATSLNRVICSTDKDYLTLARTHPFHAGIAYVKFSSIEIGVMVKGLRDLYQSETPATMRNVLRHV